MPPRRPHRPPRPPWGGVDWDAERGPFLTRRNWARFPGEYPFSLSLTLFYKTASPSLLFPPFFFPCFTTNEKGLSLSAWRSGQVVGAQPVYSKKMGSIPGRFLFSFRLFLIIHFSPPLFYKEAWPSLLPLLFFCSFLFIPSFFLFFVIFSTNQQIPPISVWRIGFRRFALWPTQVPLWWYMYPVPRNRSESRTCRGRAHRLYPRTAPSR